MKSLYTLAISVLCLHLSLGLSSCQSTAIGNDIQRIEVQADTRISDTRFQVGSTPGARLELSLPDLKRADFQVQDEDVDIDSLRLYLVSTNTGTLSPSHGPFIFNTNKLKDDNDKERIVFESLPPGTYYVAGIPYDEADGMGDNVSMSGQPNNVYIQDGSTRLGFVSDEGGEGDNGYITVHSDYTVSSDKKIELKIYVEEDD